ncbi:hypothetical protein WJX84_005631 [Apatococcus fuscideae]|uniref:Stc1 domain-containing protein n=1 Tax=Apatococcus fuscideae TaxID=2026836 RepID=A0AAW1SP33_9CHLO
MASHAAPQKKLCKSCDEEKPAADFSKNPITSDGLHTYCRDCKSVADRAAKTRKRHPSQSAGQETALEPGRTAGQPLTASAQIMHPAPEVPGMMHVSLPPGTVMGIPVQVAGQTSPLRAPPDALHTGLTPSSIADLAPGDLMPTGNHPVGGMTAAEAGASSALGVPFQPVAPRGPPSGGLMGGLQQLARQEAANAAANLGLDPGFTAAMTSAQEQEMLQAEEGARLHRFGRRRNVANNVVQTATSKVCFQCQQELPAAQFRLDRTQEDGLRPKCKACAPVKPPQDRKRRETDAAAPVTHKVCRNCNEEKPAAAFPHKRNSVDHLDYHCKACHIAATAERVARRGLVNEPAVTSKVCTRCEQELPAASFHKDRNKSDGLRGRCKPCESLNQTARRITRAPVLEPTVPSKVCRRCGEQKAAADFCRKKQRSDGLDSYCKDCNCKATAARTARKAPTVMPTVEHKVCVRCHQDKPAAEFPVRPSATDGLYSYCRICRTESANSSRLRVRERQAQLGSEDSDQGEAPMDVQEAEATAPQTLQALASPEESSALLHPS